MAEITIDGKTYEADDLTDRAKDLLTSIRFVDGHLQQLNNEWAIADTARLAYSAAFKRERDRAGVGRAGVDKA